MKKLFVFASILLLVCASTLATGCANADPSSTSNHISMESPETTVTQNFIFFGTNTLTDVLKTGTPILGGLSDKVVTIVNVGVAGVYNRDSTASQTAVPILQPVPLGDKPIQDMKDTATAFATKGGSTLLKAATEKAKTLTEGSGTAVDPGVWTNETVNATGGSQ